MRIGHKLILGFVGVALLVGLVGYLAVNASQKALEKSIGESSVSLASEVLDKIDRNLYNKIERFQGFGDPSLPESIRKSNQEFEKLDNIQNYINEKDREWTSASEEEITPFMTDLINKELSKALRKRIKFYEDQYGYRVFGEVFVTNKFGANAAQTGKTTDYYQADEQWWQIAKKDGLYVADVEYDRSANVHSTDICIRIDDETGNFLGVMKVVLSIQEVINIVKEVETLIEYNHVEVHLVKRDGKIIYAKHHRPFEDISDKKYFKGITSNKGHFIAKSHHVAEGDALYSYAHSKGYKDFKGLGWIILVEYDTEEVFAPVAQLKNNLLMISLTVTLLAFLLGIFMSASISKPVKQLNTATIEIRKGNLDTQIEIRSNDEIGQLAASFNDMARRLKESYTRLKESHSQLEERVEQRTAELKSANTKLKEEISERSRVQNTLEERIKELGCLYGVSKLVERPGISLEEIFEETVKLIRNAYQHPDVTCVKIIFAGIPYKTDNFKKTELSQYAEIGVRGDEAGAIEVYYLGEKPEDGQSPFIREERDLLDAVAERLGRITERRQAGGKLQLFRNLIDRSNDAVFVIEPQWGRFVDVNDKACESLGYTREELLSMSIRDIEELIPDDSSWQQQIEELKLKEDVLKQGQHRRKDGTTFTVESSLKLITQDKREFIIAVARDITDRRTVEEALRKSENKYRTLLENIPQMVFLKDRHSVYVSCNESYAAALKIESDEIAGRTDYEFYPEDLAEKYRADDKRIMESGATEDIEERYFRDGEERIVHTIKTPVRDPQGSVIGVLGIFWDITELKRAEQRQGELLGRLEGVNRELKDFAYIISHDLKAPLRGIKTVVDWIATDYADKLDEDGREQMDLLVGRVDRMHNLIDGVLEYSRVGRTEGKRVQVNLNELVPAIIDMVAPPENIAITVESELPVVECDETRIMQVFQNLLSNAVKYTDKPQGQVRIGCAEEDGFWKFSVADNGPGIEEKHFERIFQMFQTLSPRDEFESTGVGLTVAKKIVELYDGKIWVESKPGEGSTFFFTLPKQEWGAKNAKLEANIVSGR